MRVSETTFGSCFIVKENKEFISFASFISKCFYSKRCVSVVSETFCVCHSDTDTRRFIKSSLTVLIKDPKQS